MNVKEKRKEKERKEKKRKGKIPLLREEKNVQQSKHVCVREKMTDS